MRTGALAGRWLVGVVALTITAVPFDVAHAKVAPASLSDVVAWSDLILVGRVTGVVDEPSGQRVALVAVEQAWHGSPGLEVRIAVDPTWPCDSSRAVVGERAVFFLGNSSDQKRHIEHSGHGRMPIVENVVSVSSMVILPRQLRSRSGESQAVPLGDLEGYVRRTINKVHGQQDGGPA